MTTFLLLNSLLSTNRRFYKLIFASPDISLFIPPVVSIYVHFDLVIPLPPTACYSYHLCYPLLANSLDVKPNSKVVLIGLVATIIFCFPPPIFLLPDPPLDIPACGISAIAILANKALDKGCDLGRLTLGGLREGVRVIGLIVVGRYGRVDGPDEALRLDVLVVG